MENYLFGEISTTPIALLFLFWIGFFGGYCWKRIKLEVEKMKLVEKNVFLENRIRLVIDGKNALQSQFNVIVELSIRHIQDNTGAFIKQPMGDVLVYKREGQLYIGNHTKEDSLEYGLFYLLPDDWNELENEQGR